MDDPRVAVGRDAFRETALSAPDGARVPVELRITVDDPFLAYRRARDGTGRGAGAYLATTGGRAGWGYFGVDPVERLIVGPDAVVVGDGAADGAAADVDDGEGVTTGTGRSADSPTLSALAGLLDDETLARGDCTVPYPCGVVGWLSYDVARELESLPEETAAPRGLPRLQAALYDALVAWTEPRPDGGDPVELRVTVCPTVADDDDPGEEYEETLDKGRALVTATDRALDGDDLAVASETDGDAPQGGDER